MFEIDDRYAGRSRAIVIDNVDPLKRGRIRCRHPLLGDTVWINYLKNPGFFDVPKISDVVYLECDAGDYNHAVAHGCIVKGSDGDLDIPEVFQRTDPTNRGFYTPGGHLVELDDGVGLVKLGKGVKITTNGGIKLHLLEGTPIESKVLIETPGGAKTTIDGIMDSIVAEVAFGDKIEISALNGIQASTPTGTTLSMKNGSVEIAGTEGKLKLFAGKVGLGGPSAEVLDLFSQTLGLLSTLGTSLSTETHLGNLGYPTSPPLNAASYTQFMAQIEVIKALLTTIKGGI